MAVVLGLLVALTYGCGDFFGGLSARRTPVSTVVVGSFALTATTLLAITGVWAVLGGLPYLAARDLWIGVASGFVGPVALGLFYQGLAAGRMSVVAPTTAVVAAIVPFTWGVVHGERPAPLALGGVALALLSVGLISGAPVHASEETARGHLPSGSGAPVVIGALVSGLGFGIVFVLLGSTSDHPGLWPLLFGRLVALTLTVAAVTGTYMYKASGRSTTPLTTTPMRKGLLPARGAWRLVAVSGSFDVVANGLYLSATQLGLLSIVAVLSSLYPASTVVLARIVLNERLHVMQLVGLLVAGLGVVAMTAS